MTNIKEIYKFSWIDKGYNVILYAIPYNFYWSEVEISYIFWLK